MEKTKKKINFTGVLVVLISILLLTYTAIDMFSVRPGLKDKVDHVTSEFFELKVFLDKKLPEIDSALMLHTKQIQEQQSQLEELNQLTKILK